MRVHAWTDQGPGDWSNITKGRGTAFTAFTISELSLEDIVATQDEVTQPVRITVEKIQTGIHAGATNVTVHVDPDIYNVHDTPTFCIFTPPGGDSIIKNFTGYVHHYILPGSQSGTDVVCYNTHSGLGAGAQGQGADGVVGGVSGALGGIFGQDHGAYRDAGNGTRAFDSIVLADPESIPFTEFIKEITTSEQFMYGSDGFRIGVLDISTIIVMLVSTIAFSRSNPTVGIIVGAIILGAAMYFGILTTPIGTFSGIGMMILALAIGVGAVRRGGQY